MITPMTKKELSDYFRKLGKLGGKKSRRTLTTTQAQAMVKAREAKKKKR
jgi:hypothetical protein